MFTGELGQVETNSGRLITLSGGEVEASRPDVRCHEEGRVFTDQKLCGNYFSEMMRQNSISLINCVKKNYCITQFALF